MYVVTTASSAKIRYLRNKDATEEDNGISSTPKDKTATGSTRAEVLIKETMDGINETLPASGVIGLEF